jgi:hypothetical protein
VLKRRPPYTVIAFVAVVTTVLVSLLVAQRIDGYLLGGGFLLLLASYGLVRGIWFAWLFLTALTVADLVDAALAWPAWWTVLVNATLLVLLLAPPTRRVRPPRPSPLPRLVRLARVSGRHETGYPNTRSAG